MPQQAAPIVIPVPSFIDELVSQAGVLDADEARVRLAIQLSHENVQRGGGPFGAVVMAGSQVIAAGVNLVLASGLSIAHAEIIALMRAQQALQSGLAVLGPLALYTSTEPCCQCFGAVVWSGVTRLVCAATTQDAEAIGFDEGPKPPAWSAELEQRGIAVELRVCSSEARAVLQEYAQRGGPIYGLRSPRPAL
jgi:tRNA(Arg) A34 adenosine deaminase TadA